MNAPKIFLAASAFLMAGQTYAAGYEKSIMMGGRTSGVAGIATPYISGSESLYFNPAGLANTTGKQDVTFNISPTWPTFKGPINNQNTEVTSTTPTLLPYSLSYATNLNDKVAVGIGTFVTGGASVKYTDPQFAGYSAQPESKTDLTITEYMLGASYKINDQWSFGATWRVAQAKANFSFAQRSSGVSTADVQLTGLKDTQWGGYKLGLQFKPSEHMRFGLTYRSAVNFTAKGTMSVDNYSAGATTHVGDSSASTKTILPQAITLGYSQDLSEKWILLAEYAWTNYGKVDNIAVEGTVGTISNPVVTQNWKDQNNFRIGAEYLGLAMPIRFGYGYTSQVTNTDYARAAFSPPAAANTLTIGTGHSFNETLTMNGGFEYTWSKGSGNPNGAQPGTSAVGSDLRNGTFSVVEYALHLGLTKVF